MNYKDKYNEWLAFADENTKAELESITDEKEIEDRFYKDLAFGTGGLRGIMGAGSNRMNRYTVGKATLGLARYLKSKNDGEISVAIAYDTRNNSQYFAKVAAGIFASQNIKVNIYKMVVPVPVLSFTTHYLNCTAGVMITASHNPKEYNGYKVYDSKGCQFCTEDAKNAIGFINDITDYSSIPFLEESELINYIGENELNAFLAEVKKQSLYEEKSDLKIVYTPLHGTGNIPVRKMLEGMDVTVVKEQELPDGNFSTVRSPNPEEKDALTIAIEKAKEIGADLVLGTDPDCDRVGIAVNNGNGEFQLMTGNEVGAMLLKYICQERTALGTMPKNPVAVKTIVTTDICKKIAAEYNVELREVLTGFKFIGEQIGFLEKEGQDDRYIFGFEESYGYLAGSYVRDKDAVVGSMLICEMAAFYRTKGISLLQAREDMYKKYGNYLHSQKSFQCEGASGMERMKEIMTDLRANPPKAIGGLKVVDIADYLASEETNLETGAKTVLTLPKSDVIAFKLEQGASVIIRPSGTEPKIKAYYTTIGDTRADAEAQEEKLIEDFKGILGF